MIGDILRFLLDIAFTLFGAALIIRAWMHAVRIPPLNPLAHAVFRGTDWLVGPLRRVIPSRGRIEWACLVGAWLAALVYLFLMWLAAIGTLPPVSALPMALGAALLTVVKWILNLVVWLTLIQAVLSWVNPGAPLMPLLQTLTTPLLDPIRRILPRTTIDFSPLVLLILAQVLLMIITRASFRLFGL
ncbi:YggT family protein [Schauerella aestuarii]|uniref:YggT family protein n=1 Tax=Schauerella aestuarii TaxID=2511204 RepID=UPI001370E50B|nr:YggT family protein [Achromobacter aestuarii]MYZ42742.1 YggT family protein [Achromobacter aestuarii]